MSCDLSHSPFSELCSLTAAVDAMLRPMWALLRHARKVRSLHGVRLPRTAERAKIVACVSSMRRIGRIVSELRRQGKELDLSDWRKNAHPKFSYWDALLQPLSHLQREIEQMARETSNDTTKLPVVREYLQTSWEAVRQTLSDFVAAVMFWASDGNAEHKDDALYCRHCGYNLIGSLVRCPECGWEFTLVPAYRKADLELVRTRALEFERRAKDWSRSARRAAERFSVGLS